VVLFIRKQKSTGSHQRQCGEPLPESRTPDSYKAQKESKCIQTFTLMHSPPPMVFKVRDKIKMTMINNNMKGFTLK
jgi:hypothetical protein